MNYFITNNKKKKKLIHVRNKQFYGTQLKHRKAAALNDAFYQAPMKCGFNIKF